MTNTELLYLLAAARGSVLQHKKWLLDCDHDAETCTCDLAAQKIALLARIDAALAAHEDEERVEWTPLADGKTCASEVNGYLVEVRPSYAGDGWWAWKAEQPVMHRDRQHGHKRTKELAQEAAIAAARGLK